MSTTPRRSTRARRRPPIRPLKPSNPAGIDPAIEYSFIRQDLVRILSIGAILLVLMIVLAFVLPF